MTRRDERGQTTVLLVGFAMVITLAVGLAVDATAAYLQRQALHSLADGSALRGVDLGGTGQEVYGDGLSGETLDLSEPQARAAVHDHLRTVGAFDTYPRLQVAVEVDSDAGRVTVRLRAPLDLPIPLPGAPDTTSVSGFATAVSRVRG